MGVEDVDVKLSSKYYSNYDWWAGNNLILIDVEGRGVWVFVGGKEIRM